MEHIRKFQELLVTQKIMLFLEQEVGLRDKVLAEFILSLARQSQTVTEFEAHLVENGAEFTIDLINSLYAMITRVVPHIRKPRAESREKTPEREVIHANYHSTGVYQNLD
jgi:ATP-dependent RNA helicase DHX8/PRP22